ncbi:hypothetical protein FHY30_003227 [Xanthomonas arboricola]|uniref:hypothetical protein n=1 Tax=Xanthomonas campestris TaxID=339 RepID=UPI0023E9B03C|nr:hypothetical protein [Xanthomonas campestris]
MISLKKRNITVLSEDELTLVSGGGHTRPTDTCPQDGYTATPDCFAFPDTDGCPPDFTNDCPPDYTQDC